MEVNAMNLTAWYLAQRLVCLEDIEGGKFDVVCASAESATDKRFVQSVKKNTTEQKTCRQCRPTANQCKKQSLLSFIPKLFRDSLQTTLNIFPQVLATHLQYHMLVLLDLSGKLYKHCCNCLLFGPVSSHFSQCPKLVKLRSSNFKIHFYVQNNNNKKYKNPLAPTYFVMKEVLLFWFDNFDSHTIHSWVGFA